MKLQNIKPLQEAAFKTDDEAKQNVEEAVALFNKEIFKIFPKKTFNAAAAFKRNLGYAIVLDVSEKNVANNIIQNADQRVHLMMHLSGSSGQDAFIQPEYSFEKLSVSTKLSNAGVVYRKIKGKTPLDAVKKVLAWFKKNKETIINPNPSNDVIIKKLLKSFHKTQKRKEGKKDIITIDSGRARQFAVAGIEGDQVVLQDLPTEKLYALARAFYVMA